MRVAVWERGRSNNESTSVERLSGFPFVRSCSLLFAIQEMLLCQPAQGVRHIAGKVLAPTDRPCALKFLASPSTSNVP